MAGLMYSLHFFAYQALGRHYSVAKPRSEAVVVGFSGEGMEMHSHE